MRRQGPVAEGSPSDELGVADLLDLVAVDAGRVERREDGTDAAAGHSVDVQAGVRQLAQHTDVGEGPGAAAGENQPE